jgi:hypothetical protein
MAIYPASLCDEYTLSHVRLYRRVFDRRQLFLFTIPDIHRPSSTAFPRVIIHHLLHFAIMANESLYPPLFFFGSFPTFFPSSTPHYS